VLSEEDMQEDFHQQVHDAEMLLLQLSTFAGINAVTSFCGNNYMKCREVDGDVSKRQFLNRFQSFL